MSGSGSAAGLGGRKHLSYAMGTDFTRDEVFGRRSEMAGVNKVILVGNLGDDPEVRSLNNGGEVVNLRVATS